MFGLHDVLVWLENNVRKPLEGSHLKPDCYISIYASDTLTNNWILGSVFMQNYYMIFDLTPKEIYDILVIEELAALRDLRQLRLVVLVFLS